MLRFTFRRWTPWVVALVVLAEQSVVLRSRDSGWIGDVLWGQETVGVAQVLVLPVVAAASAVEGWKARRGMMSLLGPGRPRMRHVVSSLASWWAPLGAAYLLSEGAVFVLSARADLHVANGSVWPLATQVLGAVACSCVGFALGYWASSWTGAVAAGSLFVMLPMLGRMGALPNGFDEFSASGSMLGATPDGGFFGARATWLVVVGVLAVVVVIVTGRRARVITLSLMALTALLGLSHFANDRSYATADPGTYCSTTPTVVCGPPELRQRVDEGGRVASTASATLRALGVTARARYVMWSAATNGQDTVMLINPGRFRDPLSLASVIEDVVAPKSCGFWSDPAGPPASRLFTATAVVHQAVASAMTRSSPAGAYRTFRETVPAREQAALLARTGQALQTCRAEAIDARYDGGQWR